MQKESSKKMKVAKIIYSVLMFLLSAFLLYMVISAAVGITDKKTALGAVIGIVFILSVGIPVGVVALLLEFILFIRYKPFRLDLAATLTYVLLWGVSLAYFALV